MKLNLAFGNVARRVKLATMTYCSLEAIHSSHSAWVEEGALKGPWPAGWPGKLGFSRCQGALVLQRLQP